MYITPLRLLLSVLLIITTMRYTIALTSSLRVSVTVTLPYGKGDHRNISFIETLHLIAIEILRIYVYFKFFVSHYLRHDILSKILENSKKFLGFFFFNSIFYIFYSINIK